MDKVKSLSEFLDCTSSFPKTYFYRGESIDYGDSACVATGIRDSSNYDMYSTRINLFDRTIRENGLFDKPDLIIPFAQHSGLATKLLDVSSNSLVALYFACQPTNETLDGHVYIFDDYADATDILEKYPRFDLENELLKHLDMIGLQEPKFIHENLSDQEESDHIKEYTSVEHEELKAFGMCIEQYRNKYLRGGHSKHSVGRGISQENSPFLNKSSKLRIQLTEIKDWIINCCSNNEDMQRNLMPTECTKNTPAIDFIHPFKEKRYKYYNDQYKGFDVEVKEYLISLECLIAFINNKSPVKNLAVMAPLEGLTMDFLPNLLYRPILTFKRGLSQQSAFFVQSLFDKHEVNLNDGGQMTNLYEKIPRKLLKSQANFGQKIIIDGNSKDRILSELDKIGVNKATMFGDADNIADYLMNSNHN